MTKILSLVLILFTCSLLAQPSPLNHNRWTTNADSTIISGSTLTNVPQAAVSGLLGAYQPATSNGTNWSLHRTNDYWPTNVALQPASTALSNFTTLGTNAWIPYGTSLTKGMISVYDGTNWVRQSPLTGTRVITTDPTSPTGISPVAVVSSDNLGLGSSLPPAVLTRGSGGTAVWQVQSATTNGTNLTILLPSQFTTNVDAQVHIKSGANVTNLNAYGITAMSTFTAGGGNVGDMTNSTLYVSTVQLQGDFIANFNNISGVDTLSAGEVTAHQATFTNLSLIGDLEGGFNNINDIDTIHAGEIFVGSLSVSNSVTLGGETRTNWPSGGSSSIVTSNVVYVAKNGNDATGRSNRLDLPFLTLTAAQAAWTNGFTIHVLPGTYNEALPVQPNGIKWFFDLGAQINYTGASRSNIFTITNGTCSIGGYGVFTNATTNASATVFYNDGGYMQITAIDACATNNGIGSSALWAKSGTTKAELTGTLIGYIAGAYWEAGECSVKADRIISLASSTAGGVYVGDNATGNFWVTANEVTYVTIYGTDTARVWLSAKQINGPVNQANSRLYLTANKLNPFVNGVITTAPLNVGGGKFWGNIQKITAGSDYAVHISGGNTDAWLQFNSIEDTNNVATDLVRIGDNIHETTPGKIYISGQEAIGGTNANGIYVGDAVATIDIGRIDTSASVDKNPIVVFQDLEAPVLTIGTSQLVAPGGVDSLFSGSASPIDVIVTGRVTANTAKDSDITIIAPAYSYP